MINKSPFDRFRGVVMGNPYHGLVEGGVLAGGAKTGLDIPRLWLPSTPLGSAYTYPGHAVWATPQSWGNVPDMSAQADPVAYQVNSANGWTWQNYALVHDWRYLYAKRVLAPSTGWLTKGADGRVWWIGLEDFYRKNVESSINPIYDRIVVKAIEFGRITSTGAPPATSSVEAAVPGNLGGYRDNGILMFDGWWEIFDVNGDGSQAIISYRGFEVYTIDVAVDSAGQVSASIGHLFNLYYRQPYDVSGQGSESIGIQNRKAYSYAGYDAVDCYLVMNRVLSMEWVVEDLGSDDAPPLLGQDVFRDGVNTGHSFSGVAGRPFFAAYDSGGQIQVAREWDVTETTYTRVAQVSIPGGAVPLSQEFVGERIISGSENYQSTEVRTTRVEWGGMVFRGPTITRVRSSSKTFTKTLLLKIGASEPVAPAEEGWEEGGVAGLNQHPYYVGALVGDGADDPWDSDCANAPAWHLGSWHRYDEEVTSSDVTTSEFEGEAGGYSAPLFRSFGNKVIGLEMDVDDGGGVVRMSGGAISVDGFSVNGVDAMRNIAYHPVTGAILRTQDDSYFL